MKAVILLITLALSSLSWGQRYDITVESIGDIKFFDTENTLNVTWRGAGYFALPGISQTPDCGKDNGQYIVTFDTSKSELLSVILAAKMAGSKVKVTVEDAVKYPTGNYCKPQFITIKD